MAEPPVHSIKVQCSASNIHEYLKYSIHTLFFLRGIQEPTEYRTENYNGVPVLVPRNNDCNTYIDKDLKKIQGLIMKRRVSKFIFCFKVSDEAGELERWEFEIMPQFEDNADEGKGEASTSTNSQAKIRREILDFMRQIFETITAAAN